MDNEVNQMPEDKPLREYRCRRGLKIHPKAIEGSLNLVNITEEDFVQFFGDERLNTPGYAGSILDYMIIVDQQYRFIKPRNLHDEIPDLDDMTEAFSSTPKFHKTIYRMRRRGELEKAVDQVELSLKDHSDFAMAYGQLRDLFNKELEHVREEEID